ncbi:MAG TPA: hypothetical protein VG826_21770 [Pirellulales bacterium]|nr:hypothetical protein [Pirellulales bacterium]
MAEAERVHVIIGETPFSAERMEVEGLPDGCGCARILETVGDLDSITKGEATTYLSAGTILVVRWLEARHPTTGLRQCVLVEPRAH